MNDLTNDIYPGISNAKFLLKGLERAVIATVTESAAVHVIGDRLWGNMSFVGKRKLSLWVNKPADEPGRCGTVNSGPLTGYPNPFLVIPDAYFSARGDRGSTRGRVFKLFEQPLNVCAQRTLKKSTETTS